MCIVGGTSLATPLAAALEAVAGITDLTPTWTYSSSPLLNDVLSGSDGSCPSAEYLICNAAAGWDGPTGNGSISGDVGVAPPGIGSNLDSGVNGTDVTFTGGVYPNGSSTTYNWQYRVHGTISITSTSPTTSSGLGLQSASVTLCGALTPGTAYDYNLVATNSSGTTNSGFQGSFTTPASQSAPTTTAAPTTSGLPQPGQTLSARPPTWNDQSCNSSPSYQWQEASNPAGPWAVVGTSLTYALSSADLGQYVRFVATESNGVGSGNSASAVIGPVAVPGTSTATSTTKAPPTTTTPAPPTTSTVTVSFYRCARSCSLINTHGATTYRPGRVDYGRYIKEVTTLTRIVNKITTAQVSTRWTGPVTSSTAGAVSIGSGARAAAALRVKSSTRKLLAQARIAKRTRKTLTVVIASRKRPATKVWAYVISKGAVVSCTGTHSLAKAVTLAITVKTGQTVKLVAVQT
jgi:hypothetical protein